MLSSPSSSLRLQFGNAITVVTHINLLLYGAAYWMHLTLLPYLASSIGGSVSDLRVLGTLLTVFSAIQMIGSTLFGRFADAFGGRTAMLLAFSCSILNYSLLYFADSSFLLFVSRIPALGQHALHASQIVMSLQSSEHARAATLGRLGVSYGIGFAVGPLIGGYLATTHSVRLAVLLAVVVSALSLFLTFMFVTDTPVADVVPKYMRLDGSEPPLVSRVDSVGFRTSGVKMRSPSTSRVGSPKFPLSPSTSNANIDLVEHAHSHGLQSSLAAGSGAAPVSLTVKVSMVVTPETGFQNQAQSCGQHYDDPENCADAEAGFAPRSAHSLFKQWYSFKDLFRYPLLKPLLTAKAAGGLSFALFHSSFSMLAVDTLHFSAQESGYVIAFVGFVAMIAQGLLVGRLGILFQHRELTLVRHLSIGLVLSFCMLSVIDNSLISVFTVLVPIVICGTVIATTVTAQLTKCVEAKDVGTVLGLDMTVGSSVRVIAPSIGGILISIAPEYGFALVGGAAALLCASLWTSFWYFEWERMDHDAAKASGSVPVAPGGLEGSNHGGLYKT
eukprot:ANDGO_03247.mRNA.1 Tetracycline resistance protein